MSSGSSPVPGNNSPQLKKSRSSPAWGSGAIPSPTCPARPPFRQQFTSPPPYMPNSPYCRPPQQQFRNRMTSPRHAGYNFNNRPEFGNGNHMFRTPQPIYRGPISPQKSWSCDSNFRYAPKRLNMKSPRREFNSNPGGSNDIDVYYHPSMLDDPWQSLTPIPVSHTPVPTT